MNNWNQPPNTGIDFIFNPWNSDFFEKSLTWQAAAENVGVTALTPGHSLARLPIKDDWVNEKKCSQRVNKALFKKSNKEFMEWNDNGELSNNILWDVSKTVIRGKLMQY